jgi:hypothetical protein
MRGPCATSGSNSARLLLQAVKQMMLNMEKKVLFIIQMSLKFAAKVQRKI